MCKKVVKALAGFGRVVCVGAVLCLVAGLMFTSTVSGVASGEVEPVPVEVEFYALEYEVSHAEASRRLQRIGVIKEVLAEIRGVEKERLAGWGIDHRDRFTGWVPDQRTLYPTTLPPVLIIVIVLLVGCC